MKKRLLLVFVLAFCLIAPHSALAAAKYTYKLAHNLPAPDSSYHQTAEFFKNALEKHSNGQATILIYPGGQLGSDTNIAKKMQTGGFDFEIITTNKLGAFFPKIDIYSLPFLFPDFASVNKVVKTKQHNDLMQEMEKATGLKSLAFSPSGFRNITNSKRPVNTPADVRDLKMRVPQNSVEIAMFRALGASAVSVSDSELFTALQQGMVDGQDGSALWAYSKKIYEAQKYMSTTMHQLSCSTLIASSRVFAGMPKEIQEAVIKAGLEAQEFWYNSAVEENKVVMQHFADSGMLINEPDKQAFMDAMKVVYEEFADAVGGMDKITAIQKIVAE